MKEVEKLEKQLKKAKWMNKHLNKVILGIVLPCTFLGQCLAPIIPLLGISFMLITIVTGFLGGIVFSDRWEDTEYIHLLERQIYYAKNATAESVKSLDSAIKDLKSNPTKIKDKETTRSLIKDLIKIKASTQRALNDQQKPAKTKKHKENDANQENNIGI